MDLQSILVAAAVAGAAGYVVRSLWPRRKPSSGCSSCPQNASRRDDYA